MNDFDAWWELRGCREEYGNQEAAARAAWEVARQKYEPLPEVTNQTKVPIVIHGRRPDKEIGKVNWVTGKPYRNE